MRPEIPKQLSVNKSKLRKKRELFSEIHAVAPAPSRDYYALQLYQKKLLLTKWTISHKPITFPTQKSVSLEEFSKDSTFKSELTYIFGHDVIGFIDDLVNEKWSLITMPSSVLQEIFSYISVPDILRLSQVCRRLSKECSVNELWQAICKKQWKILLHNDIQKASLIGWKKVYLEKMRPKKYNTQSNKSGTYQRNTPNTRSSLNTRDSKITVKSSTPMPKKIQVVPKSATIRSSSEIFGKDFKVMSTSTGKLTERTYKTKTSRNSECSTPLTSFSRSKCLHQSSHSVLNLMPLLEIPRESEYSRGIKPQKTIKNKVNSIQKRSLTANSIRRTESVKIKTENVRPESRKLYKKQ